MEEKFSGCDSQLWVLVKTAALYIGSGEGEG